MAESPLPSPDSVAELARRGAALRAEAERLVTDALRAVAGDPALGAEAGRDVAEFLARRAGRAPSPGEVAETSGSELPGEGG